MSKVANKNLEIPMEYTFVMTVTDTINQLLKEFPALSF